MAIWVESTQELIGAPTSVTTLLWKPQWTERTEWREEEMIMNNINIKTVNIKPANPAADPTSYEVEGVITFTTD